jgi:hypothetical protein
VEFSTDQPQSRPVPVAWVSNWTDEERRAMTCLDQAGRPTLRPGYRGRRALIEGLDYSAKAQRIRHARLLRWFAREDGTASR